MDDLDKRHAEIQGTMRALQDDLDASGSAEDRRSALQVRLLYAIYAELVAARKQK